MARIAGVAGCTVSLLSTLQAPDLGTPQTLRSRPSVTARWQTSSMVARLRLAPDQGIRPAIASVAEFTYDSDSDEFLSDQSLLDSLPDEECGEEACFALEGYVTSGTETLASLGQRYGLSPDALSLLNGKPAAAPLPPGTRVTLYRGDYVIYTAEKGESLEDIGRKFGTDALLLTVCNHCKSEQTEGGERLFIPQGILEREGEAAIVETPASDVVIAAAPEKPAKVAKASRKRRGRGFEKVINFAGGSAWQWPIQGRVTSRFGWRHHPILNRSRFHAGLDISASSGTPIRAVAPGRVIYSGWRGACGRTVVVRHANNLVTMYGHCSSLLAEVGQAVDAGQLIARVGSSGRATGSHLHFAMEQGKTPVNPMKYLR